jgi:AcrR family transcriptional regulator
MHPSPTPDEAMTDAPPDIRARVLAAAFDELVRWGVDRFSIEAMAERHRLEPATVYRYWGNRQRLIIDAALGDSSTLLSGTDTGSLRGDLQALARNVAGHLNTHVGRTLLRALVMNGPVHHDQDTRMMFWQERFKIVRGLVDRARERGELRAGVQTLAAVQIVVAPLNIRALYSDDAIDDAYCDTIAELAWHALARKQPDET